MARERAREEEATQGARFHPPFAHLLDVVLVGVLRNPQHVVELLIIDLAATPRAMMHAPVAPEVLERIPPKEHAVSTGALPPPSSLRAGTG
jgi:hypothetical protein